MSFFPIKLKHKCLSYIQYIILKYIVYISFQIEHTVKCLYALNIYVNMGTRYMYINFIWAKM